MQERLNQIYAWRELHLITFNASKFQLLDLTCDGNAITHDISFGDISLNWTLVFNDDKYLGIYVLNL